MRHEVNQGKVAALRTGVMYARGDVIIFIGADNIYPALYIPLLIQEIEKGADLVLGAMRYKGVSE